MSTATSVRDYPQSITPVGHVEPVPRRVRAMLAGQTVLDTTAARYVWEWPNYPQFYVPLADVAPGVLVDEDTEEDRQLGPARRHGLRVGDVTGPARRGCQTDRRARRTPSASTGGRSTPGSRRTSRSSSTRGTPTPGSTRSARAGPCGWSSQGALLAESSSPVFVFETGLPTRYYLPRTALNLAVLEPSDTVTECPYKGRTSAYWSARVGDRLHPDLAWSYDFPTRQLLPITGLVAFYNEKVDITLDGQKLERPRTHFS